MMESMGPVQIPRRRSSTVGRPQQTFDVPILHAAREGATKRAQRKVFLCWLIQALGRLIDSMGGRRRWPHAMGACVGRLAALGRRMR